ncbi:DUF192 domain-containing protein [archaeon]|nr:DUF192 domain-containing protein [archaeon]
MIKNDTLLTAAILVIAVLFLVYTSLHYEGARYVEIDAINTTKIVLVEIANDPISYERGLMGRENLDKDSGMLFIFDDEIYRSFWMKNTLIPLDIIFVSSNYTIVDMKENFMPCDSDPCQTYSSKNPAKFVIEVNAGYVKDHEIEIGDNVKIY